MKVYAIKDLGAPQLLEVSPSSPLEVEGASTKEIKEEIKDAEVLIAENCKAINRLLDLYVNRSRN